MRGGGLSAIWRGRGGWREVRRVRLGRAQQEVELQSRSTMPEVQQQQVQQRQNRAGDESEGGSGNAWVE